MRQELTLLVQMRFNGALNLITHNAISHAACLLTFINGHAIIKLNVALHSVNAADDIAIGIYLALGLFVQIIVVADADGFLFDHAFDVGIDADLGGDFGLFGRDI